VQVFRPLGIVLRRIVELPPEPESLKIEVPPHASPEIVAMVNAVQDMRERLLTFQREVLSEARFAVMGKLATHMAHEIRNPLEAISGAVELIEPEVTNPSGREYLGVIREEIGILNDYLKEVLEVAKPELSHPSLTDLSVLVQETLLLVSPLARKRGVSLTLEVPPEGLSTCWVDRSQLKRVFLNLVLNAIEASTLGKEVQLRLQQQADGVWVWVKDFGCGIPEEILPRVFDPYFTTKEGGTGLGLSLSKRIVEGHGGSIGISSRAGWGTEVWVWLPISEGRKDGTDPVSG
jgi:signal transduction histidine kinase